MYNGNFPKSAIVKSGARLLPFLLALVGINCFNEPLTPVPPSWDTQLTFPLLNRTYTISDIVDKDSSLLRVGAGNLLTVSTSSTIRETYVGDVLSLNPKDTSVQFKLGPFAINTTPLSMPIDIPWLPGGMSVPLPDTNIVVADIEAVIPSFEEVTFASGTISLTMENKLPVAVEVTSPVRLVNPLNGTVATFVFNPPLIPAKGSRTATDDLANETLRKNILISNIALHTAGSLIPVPIPVGELLVATLTTSDLKAKRAVFADIPQQSLSHTDTAKLKLDDSTLVKELILKSGGLNLNIVNNIDLGVMFKYKFQEMFRRDGSAYVPYEDSLYLNARGSGQMTIDLSQAKIRSLDGSLMRSISVESSMRLSGNGGQNVALNETDKVTIAISKSAPLVIDSALAVIKPTRVNVNSVIGIRLGEFAKKFSGSINIPSASLGLRTSSAIGFPADLYLRLGAKKNATGDSVFMNIPASQRRVNPGAGLIQFDAAQVGQFLSQFGGHLPDSLRISGTIVVNPADVYSPNPAGVGSVGKNSSFGGTADFQIPLNLGIADGLFTDTLVVGDTSGNGNRTFVLDKERIQSLNSGKVYLEIRNGLPIQLGLSLKLLDRTRQSILRIPQSGIPIDVTAARVDGEGTVTVPADRTTVIELTQSEVQQFNLADFISYSFNLNTAAGSPSVRLRTTDYVGVRIWTNLSYRVK